MIFQHNGTDVTASQSSTVVNEVLNQWNAVSPIPVVSTNFGTNTFSYSNDTRYFGPGVVAVTILNYDAGVGRVSSGQILVNQTTSRGFCLTADKAGNNCTTPGAGLLTRVYLGDVVAHEMGHLLGLGHSEVRDSSMLFTTFKGQHTPHADDVAGVRKIYSSPGYGTLSGTVLGGNRTPVFGAHVQAISTRTGAIAAATLSQENGSFIIEGLELSDTYYIYVEPLNYLEGLPDAYRSAQKDFCPGAYVGSFFETCGSAGKGHPQPLKLTCIRWWSLRIQCNDEQTG
jgi:Matrixin